VIPDPPLAESHPIIRAKRRLGRARRYLARRWWARLNGREYRAWLEESDKVRAGSVENAVPIAVIVPVFDPPLEFLQECIASVRNQSACHWQLIIVDDGSTSPEIQEYLAALEEQTSGDERVAVIRGVNAGISGAQNRGLDRVTCEYFGWLDHDDQLNPVAIESFSHAITDAKAPPAVVYSDEDKIDARGCHFELYCKPDYSPELLLTQMYLCHFTVFRTSDVRDAGGFDSAMDGAQDFDLALRLMPGWSRENVVHVPKPLYHWRSWEQSTAQSIQAKPWAQQAAARAQYAHLLRSGLGGEVEPSTVAGLNEVHPEISVDPAEVCIIIPTAGVTDDAGVRFVDRAVDSLRDAHGGGDVEIVVVTTGDLQPIAGVDQQVTAPEGDFNFSRVINAGRQQTRQPWLLLLNDDIEAASPDVIMNLLETASIPGVGVVGSRLIYPDGRLQHAGIVILPSGPTHPFIGARAGHPGYFGSTLTPRNHAAVTAAAMLVRTSVFDSLGGFDEEFARDFNDVDFCLRAWEAGSRVAWTPYATFIHHEGVSLVRRSPDPRESELFSRRWGSMLPDPWYSGALHQSLGRLYQPL
jgi:GT2 family glycosyltransferase